MNIGTPFSNNHDLACAFKLVLQAAASVRASSQQRRFESKFKQSGDIVTSADLEAEQIVIDGLRRGFPDDLVLAEETADHLSRTEIESSRVWVLDPIDGTTNFAYGIPHVGVSLALAQRGETRLGLVLNPFSGELFWGVRGSGAFLTVINLDFERPNFPSALAGSAQLHCGSATSLRHSVIATGFATSRTDYRPYLRRVSAVIENCFDIRRLGAASLDICFVAAGRLDGFYEGLNPWDIAAARLIACEAGCRCGQFKDEIRLYPNWVPEELDGRGFMAAAPGVFDDLKNLLDRA